MAPPWRQVGRALEEVLAAKMETLFRARSRRARIRISGGEKMDPEKNVAGAAFRRVIFAWRPIAVRGSPLSQLDLSESRQLAWEKLMDLSPADQLRGMAELRLMGRLGPQHLLPSGTLGAVFVARQPAARPLIGDYIHYAVHEFCELHGDRVYGDDPAIVTGFRLDRAYRVMLIRTQPRSNGRRARRMQLRLCRPEGYRKAAQPRCVSPQEFGLPIDVAD